MGLLDRVARHDSITEMEAARDDRYWDGLTCALEEREFAACYLMGYAIEMLLKTAFFRFAGLAASSDLGAVLQEARQLPRFRSSGSRFPGQARGIHNVRAWGEHLIEVRQRAQRPLDAVLAGTLIYQLGWVEDNWSEILRYRRSVSAREEVSRFLAIIDWLRAEYSVLWE